MTASPVAARATGTVALRSLLMREIENLNSSELPLDSGTAQGGDVADSRLSGTIPEVAETARVVQARVGVFLDEVVGGCSCGCELFTVNACREAAWRKTRILGLSVILGVQAVVLSSSRSHCRHKSNCVHIYVFFIYIALSMGCFPVSIQEQTYPQVFQTPEK
jgi:hypothetical protein